MDLISFLNEDELSPDDLHKLRKMLLIFLVGELYGLHNLHQILQAQGIKSKKLYKVWQKFTYVQLLKWVNNLLLRYFFHAFIPLAKKSLSTESRSCMTISIDHSIFKHWLQNFPKGDLFDKYFSGQYNSVVYGFRLTLLGISIKGTFYPLYFDLTGKKDDPIKKSCKLLKKTERLLQAACKEFGLELPKLYLSVDNGFNDKRLIVLCEQLAIRFICVPKRTHVFYVNNNKFNAKEFIEDKFIPKEAEHLAKYEAQKNATNKEEIPPFLMRVRAYYNAQKEDVVLLFFRLAGSKKVSVIYTTHTSMMAKTLRRRWFQRTYIEQFFRLVKNTLKIQLSISDDSQKFLKKTALFFLKAIVAQLYRKFCNRKWRLLKNWSFEKLQFQIIRGNVSRDILQELIESV